MLSGRDRGGAVWTVDLLHVSDAVYAEYRGLSALRYALRVKTPDGWREIVTEAPRRQMAQSRDVAEHRALSAAVAERLANLRPGFRIGFQVSYASGRVLLTMALGLLVAVTALILGGLQITPQAGGVATMSLALVAGGGMCAYALLQMGALRRWPDVSAAALPGILTAYSRRE
jgi:hypothetical protein